MKICDNENFKNSVYIITNVIFIFCTEWSVADLHMDALKRIDRAGGSAPG